METVTVKPFDAQNVTLNTANEYCCRGATTEPLLSHYWVTTERLLSHYWVTTDPLLSNYWATTEPLLSHCWATTEPLLSHYWATAAVSDLGTPQNKSPQNDLLSTVGLVCLSLSLSSSLSLEGTAETPLFCYRWCLGCRIRRLRGNAEETWICQCFLRCCLG